MSAILYTATQLPEPAHTGGSQRTRLCWDRLRELGPVDCAFILPEEPPAATREFLRQRCRRLFLFTKAHIQQARPANRLRRLLPGSLGRDLAFFLDADRYRWCPHQAARQQIGDLRQYPFVVARYLQSAATFGLLDHPRLFLDVDDFDPDRLRSRLPTVNPVRRLALLRCLRFSSRAHRSLLPRAHHLWVSNAQDRRHPELQRASWLPNIPFPENLPAAPPPPAASTGPVLLMVGTFSYSANQVGLHHFLRHAWPRIRSVNPKAQLEIVGHSSREALPQQVPPGVMAHGAVDRLEPFYLRARAAIAPILSGAGTNIKILEAASFARAAIATPQALRGLCPPFTHGTSCLQAALPEAFAAACLDLLHQPERADSLGKAARAIVLHSFSPASFTSAFLDPLPRPAS